MRGGDERRDGLFSYVRPESRIPKYETVQNLGVITPLCETDTLDGRSGGPLIHSGSYTTPWDTTNVVMLAPGSASIGLGRSHWNRGVYGPTALGRESEMKWRVMVELSGADGAIELHEVSVGASPSAACSAETLGLTAAEGRKTLAGLQSHLVRAQTEERRDVPVDEAKAQIRRRLVEIGEDPDKLAD
jgi:hypothetical protein